MVMFLTIQEIKSKFRLHTNLCRARYFWIRAWMETFEVCMEISMGIPMMIWWIERARFLLQQHLRQLTTETSSTLDNHVSFRAVRMWMFSLCVITKIQTIQRGELMRDYFEAQILNVWRIINITIWKIIVLVLSEDFVLLTDFNIV